MSTPKVNPHRPYYTPGLHHHNYTSLPSTSDASPLVLEDNNNTQLKSFTARCTSFALLKYFVTMLTSPFEVGTTLLQVQYSPHEDVEVIGIPIPLDSTFQLTSPTEGWRSLFKGQRVTWIYDMLRTVLRPALESSLNDVFGLYDDTTIPLLHLDSITANMATMIVSHLVIGVLLSPLEIIRTRLIVQSASPHCSKYKGLFHALRTMFSEEGGIRGVYLSKNLVPTLFYHTMSPLISCSTPLLIARLLHISATDSPILYGAAELTLSTLGLLITLPLETIRKRLQCQTTNPIEFKTTVALRPQPYRGLLDALYKILKEEGTRYKRNNNRKKAKVKNNKKRWSSESDTTESDISFSNQQKHTPPPPPPLRTSAWGIRGLYRGFSMQMAANIMLFVFQTMNVLEGK
ncbi:mitochondrial carrier domain-containing protein [Cokeromyces recurvatus]|uniref:mitochondrial carrier domain-containing protein n=1 Tax=Cokeromyces recurvatus TaxID=90255 RepID=UPI002220C88B|nr:mitochondrial carrier domain-containing protein [Cokeromyces recurvatus]KAI7907609.1 mitochondrial carrier domain-containing protein [Cokeromyces recurvatus]